MDGQVESEEEVFAEDVAVKTAELLAGEPDYPREGEKDNIFKFFKHLLGLKDSSKSANLSEPELGKLFATVRAYQDIALYCDAIGYDLVARYCRDTAEVVLATSLSRKGFLAQLFVTQIKRESKFARQPVMSKGGLFSKAQPVESGNIEEA